MMRRLVGPAFLLLGAACLGAWASAPRAAWPESPAEAADRAHFPESGMIVRGEIGEAIERRDAAGVAEGARALAAMGGGLSIASRARIAPFLSEAERARLAARFDANDDPVVHSTLEAEVPADHRIVEGIAWDGATGRLFAGTVIDGELLVSEGGGWRGVPLDGPVGGLFGMAVDAPRRRLWITSGVAEQVARPERAFRGLIAVDLDRLAVARRVPLPAEETGSPGDLAIGADGTVYVSNGESGAIHICAPGCAALDELVAPGRFRNPQGLALSRDGRRLYIADYGYGIAIFDLRSRHLSRLAAAVPMMLDGIDGLMRHGDDLVAIQNGTNPRRIVRLRLARGGREVRRLDVLARSSPDWAEPTLGVIADRRLLFVADGQWERYAARGRPINSEPARPTPIRALDLPK
ncbi:hypothetical protein SAMN06295912_1334 [Sphingomonas laterariae]|uniref:Sugar lactone lactonase YvrE n=1 Tax=Edaphosphingomonas laterariae TaxID=861865 RepID=A0A239JC02_9SPHN|nr:hypothetical protein [Sphingomonas laterariae]SNT03357.1 hypothetical protein SAMN06295912_1334 [Sphingomonas laterariae]